MTVSPSGTVIQFGRTVDGLPPQLLMCGVCDKPATIHRNHEDLDAQGTREFCDRGYENDFVPVEALNDYYLHSGSSTRSNYGVVPFVDYTGNAANIEALLNHSEDEFLVEASFQEQIENWRDTNPLEHTHALDDWYYCQRKFGDESFYRTTSDEVYPSTSPEIQRSRNVYVEGQSGFFSVQVYDPELTNKYALRLLNVFTNKRGTMQCGGVEVLHNLDGTITARCVQNSCPSTQFTIDPDNMDREAMEEFVLTVIRHGNNHAAAWFRNRNTFYKIHSANCAGSLSEPCPVDLHYCPKVLEPQSVQ